MSLSLNTIMMSGNLVNDPDLKSTSAGDPLVEFRIGSDGKGRGDPIYINIVAFRRLAETCNTYLSKGDLVIVSGKLKYNEWTSPEGHRRSEYKVFANDVQFVKTKGKDKENKTQGW